jgi:hypothetical protein
MGVTGEYTQYGMISKMCLLFLGHVNEVGA